MFDLHCYVFRIQPVAIRRELQYAKTFVDRKW